MAEDWIKVGWYKAPVRMYLVRNIIDAGNFATELSANLLML